MTDPALIALDWGTTNVRAALLDGEGQVLEARKGESGVGSLDEAGFIARFGELTEGWPKLPAIACGMVGSRQGWSEAHYCELPLDVSQLAAKLHRTNHLTIVPGVMKDTLDQADVMRGEETQIAALLAENPAFDGTIVLPGTHSKWARIAKGKLVDFKTYMTGELFDAFAGHTILRHTVQPAELDADDNAFDVAVGDVFMTKGSDWGRFFNLRAAALVGETLPGQLREKLSGYLIGMELSSAAQDGFDVQAVTIIGGGALVERYTRALAVLAADVTPRESDTLIWPALFALAQQANMIGNET
ncbi:2-dehydro-3-deoxygalactonokinase [Ahrensia sp. R2A130]|uniref:2-dehydro-3-deoxygalactonokinase n=1 Tax=Ahrensia sp. R2A130 TaxID=744979 RepID=UPI0001E083EE|nr:2-dehydro-3-deoxygalactonokinase [Ahrensia sp. R2A130]EFL89237.1 2-dehydro-3-deoxygalactonokinase [Ahrensia sp. R2A130]